MTVSAALWVLNVVDIANAGGICQVTLKSGVQLTGRVDKRLSTNGSATLHLKTDQGWHSIDYEEIAAISGEPYRDT